VVDTVPQHQQVAPRESLSQWTLRGGNAVTEVEAKLHGAVQAREGGHRSDLGCLGSFRIHQCMVVVTATAPAEVSDRQLSLLPSPSYIPLPHPPLFPCPTHIAASGVCARRQQRRHHESVPVVCRHVQGGALCLLEGVR
jgi:hypothetical protein